MKSSSLLQEGVVEFIQDTGLEKVFRNKQITNLVDYVFGVEMGLDTYARRTVADTSWKNGLPTS